MALKCLIPELEKSFNCVHHSGLYNRSYKSSLILHLFLKWILNISSHKEVIQTGQ